MVKFPTILVEKIAWKADKKQCDTATDDRSSIISTLIKDSFILNGSELLTSFRIIHIHTNM